MGKKDLYFEVENYHPDIEIVGSGNIDYGHTLAERLEKYNNNFNDISKLMESNEDKKDLSGVLKYSPRQLRVTKNRRTKLKGELSRLKKSGYDIGISGDLKIVSTEKMWNSYVRTLKNNNYFN